MELKAIQLLLKEEKISADCVLMLDEMFLQKSADDHSGSFVGQNENGEFYNVILVFMIVGLKESIPYVIEAIPKTSLNGEMVKDGIQENLHVLKSANFNVRSVISDNHSTNVLGFSMLKKEYGTTHEDDYFIFFEGSKIYLMFDSVHLIKNVRNNLLNTKRFVFPPFEYLKKVNGNSIVNVNGGEISWSLLHQVRERDGQLMGNLRKAPKFTFKTLHPGDNKQDVIRALNIFHDTTSTAIENYFPNEKSAANFLVLFNTWWNISNSKVRYSNNHLCNAAIIADGKTDFLRTFAKWIKSWHDLQIQCAQRFTLSTQTTNAFVITLNATASLIDDLLSEGYKYVLTSRFQSDPLERRFSKYRQMSDGRFLVALREVKNSEKILQMESLLKEGFNFWNMDLHPEHDNDTFETNISTLSNEIQECGLDSDGFQVAVFIAGYITKKTW